MTRGTALLITNDDVFQSNEFNGDMYQEGYGAIFLKELHKVKGEKSFEKMIKGFNTLHHQYKEGVGIRSVKDEIPELKDNRIDFWDRYFDRFFSDWMFVKNLSDETVTIVGNGDSYENLIKTGTVQDRTEKGMTLTLEPGQTVALPFGKVCERVIFADGDGSEPLEQELVLNRDYRNKEMTLTYTYVGVDGDDGYCFRNTVMGEPNAHKDRIFVFTAEEVLEVFGFLPI